MGTQVRSELETAELIEILNQKLSPHFPSSVLPAVEQRKLLKSPLGTVVVPDETEVIIRAPPAMSVDEFCKIFGIGRSIFYEEVNSSRLKLRKIGNRSVVTGTDFIEYILNLPLYVPRGKDDDG